MPHAIRALEFQRGGHAAEWLDQRGLDTGAPRDAREPRPQHGEVVDPAEVLLIFRIAATRRSRGSPSASAHSSA